MQQFFAKVREGFGSLSQNEVNGINVLLAATEGLPLRHRAYILATAWHETGPESSILHMTPRREIWGPSDAQKGYEGREDLGNIVAGDGKRFMGRGYVQITGRRNYERASKLVGQDLVTTPDLALKAPIASKIIVDGMVNGWFTGKKMADFTDYAAMRAVVNGSDKAELIAGYAQKFEAAFRAQGLADAPTAPAPIPAQIPSAPVAVPAGYVSKAELAAVLRRIADELAPH